MDSTAALSPNAACGLVGLFAGMLATIVNEEMKQASPHFKSPIAESYDFIIVGAGTAGSVVASRLSENPAWRVLLLEDGGPATPIMDVPGQFGLNFGNNVKFFMGERNSRALNGGSFPIPRGKVLGGSGTINAMMYARGNRRDFDRWAAQGNEGWDYKSVLKYFKKSEKNTDPLLQSKYHGRDGPMVVSTYPSTEFSQAMLEAFEWYGFPRRDYNGEEQVGVDFQQNTVTATSRQSTYSTFIKPNLDRPNLHVKIHSRVTKVILDGKKATGVEFSDSEGKKHEVYASQEVIISAGPIESPQILMLSGIGPRDHLESKNISVYADLPVGENLQDHPIIFSSLPFKVPNPKLADGLNAKVLEHITYMKDQGGSMSLPPSHIMAFKSFTEDPMEGDVCYFVGKSLHGTPCITDADLYTHISIFTVLMRSYSKGRISLRDADPFSDPVIDLNLLHDPRDAEILKKGLKAIINIKDAPSLSKLNLTLDTTPLSLCSDHSFWTDEYWDCVVKTYTQSLFHESGTCRMGPKSDPTTVVDRSLKVHGFDNLRVVDSSIMPLIVSANLNAATIMIAEKASDMIKEAWDNFKTEL